ncbi:MAG: hypothetical protein Q8K12_11155 [Thiobacillus sp.]|nr:hypothetical protein [Thiobacillus sp.]
MAGLFQVDGSFGKQTRLLNEAAGVDCGNRPAIDIVNRLHPDYPLDLFIDYLYYRSCLD